MAKKNRTGGEPGFQLGTDEEIKEMEDAGRKGLFGRLNKNLNEAIQQNRGSEGAAAPADAGNGRNADDIAIRRARSTGAGGRMVIPEGVTIEGNITGVSETEIAGRVEGNVQIDGTLALNKSALITGNVRAGSCRVEGLIEGKLECSDEVDLGQGGRVNGDVNVGKRINLAGQVYGNVTTPGVLRLAQTCQVKGDVRARSLSMEEGATLDGSCVMRPPSQK